MQNNSASFTNRSKMQNHKNDNIVPLGKSSADIRTINLHVKNLKLPAYQRKPDNKRVQSIINNYDPHRDRPVEVSYRNGEYWIVDGQHRVRVHEIMGHEMIQCMVHYGLSYQEEASLFARQHDGERRVSSKDCWLASLEAEDKAPEVQAIIQTCKKHGFMVRANYASGRANVFTCVNELQKLYKKHGKNGLETMLFVIGTAWPTMPNNTHREIVGGVTKLMDTFELGDKEWNSLRDRLAKITPEHFLRLANTANGRGSKRAAIRMAIIYNSGRAVKNRLNEYLIK